MDLARCAAEMGNRTSPIHLPNKRPKTKKKKGGDHPPPPPPPQHPPDLPSEALDYCTDAGVISPNEGDETDLNSNDPDANMPPNRQRPVPKREADVSLILTTAQRAELGTLVDSIMDKLGSQSTKPFEFLHLPVAQANRVKVWNYGPAMEAAIAACDHDANDWGDGDGFPENAIKVYGYCKPSKPVQQQGEETQATPGQASGEPGIDAKQTPAPSPAPNQVPSPALVDGGEDADDGNGPKARTFIIAQIDADSVKATVPSMSELQKDVVSYFAKWRNTFQKRLNDLVVPKFPANPTVGPPGQGQGPPRGGGAGAGIVPGGRDQQPKQGAYTDLP